MRIRQGRYRRDVVVPDLADEAEPLARDGAQQALFGAGVRDRLAHGVDVAGDRGLGDDPAAPYHLQQFVLADHAVTMEHQVQQQIEDLRADGNGLPAQRQFPALVIEQAVFERESHGQRPCRTLAPRARGNRVMVPD